MNTGWSPKPLRPEFQNELFPMVESPTVVKSMTPIERQREEDGTPMTAMRPSRLRPPDPEQPRLFINKGSLVEKYDERPKMPKQDPEDPMTTVKSYMAFKSKETEHKPDQEMAKSVSAMNAAIAHFAAKASAKSGS